MRYAFLLILGIFAFIVFPSSAAEYCVLDLPDFVQNTAVSDELKIAQHGASQELIPARLHTGSDGAPIFADVSERVIAPGGVNEYRSFIWLPDKAHRLKLTNRNGSRLYGDEKQSLAVGESSAIFIQASGKNYGDTKTELYQVSSEIAPSPLPPETQKLLKWPTAVFWSDFLKKYIITTQDRFGTGTIHTSAKLFDGFSTFPLNVSPIHSVVDLPDLGVTALIGYRDVSFIDSMGHSYLVTELNPGDDYGEINGIYELENQWLYIPADQYRHIIHVYKNALGQWQSDKIIRINQSEGFFDRLIRKVTGLEVQQIERDKLKAIAWVEGKLVYSKALKRLLIPETMQEFYDGQQSAFSHGDYMYVGDIPSLHIAIFKKKDGQLYSYDGSHFRPVLNGMTPMYWGNPRSVELGWITDLLGKGRAFYTTHVNAYEITKSAEQFVLKRLDVPEAEPYLTFGPFMPLSDDIAFITGHDIILLSTLKSAYSTATPAARINTFGNQLISPVYIPQWNGLLFSTSSIEPKYNRNAQYYLLTTCQK